MKHNQTKWHNKAISIYNRLVANASTDNFTEDYGQKEYSTFEKAINLTDLSYSQKASIKTDLFNKIIDITPTH